MKFVADLHLHSKFSRATSRDMTLDQMACWAAAKGVGLLASADFTHPEWLFLMKAKLEPTGDGLFRLKSLTPPEDPRLQPYAAAARDVRFLLSTEISFIYSKQGKVRKIHLLLFAPDLESVDKINARLGAIGNLRSDGRPILGLDVKPFVKMVADLCPAAVVVPCHIWTPWFSLFGANSGFDRIEDCFEEMTPRLFAVETGLSSDPAMNWRLSALDRYVLISNSDAHSPSRIGREANVFDTELSYRGLVDALRSKDPAKFLYTVEFYPEEGKYHYDGHRKCGVVLSPRESIQQRDICPRCGKKLTIGVAHRVEELADREQGVRPPGRIPYKNLVPLNEIIAEAQGKSSDCRSVWDLYFHFLHEFGDEHRILTEVPVAELGRLQPEAVGQGIERMRQGRVRIQPGHDGEYGRILVLSEEPGGDQAANGQLSLF
jgi:uncharacterized protein (TIGR00375 family)